MLLDQAKTILSEVLRPVDYDSFLEKIVERQPVVIKSDGNPDKAGMIGPQPKETILQAYEQFAPTLTCHAFAPTGPTPKARPVADEAGFRALLSEYHKLGYTVRIPSVNSLSQELKAFTRALEVVVENPVDAVVFWSEADAKAPIHHDADDLICIQLIGQKKWFISKDQAVLPNPWKPAGEGPPPFEQFDTLIVNRGDVIYLPRGTAHSVHSQSESVHLSIGFLPVTVREVVTAMIDHLADEDRSIRTCVTNRADQVSSPKELGRITSRVQEALELLKSKCASEEFVDMALQRRKARMTKDLPKLTDSAVVPDLSESSRLRHNPLSLSNHIVTPHTIDVSQPGETILIHLGAQEALDFITSTPEFSVADIPGELTLDTKIALVGRFVSNAFLEVVQ